WRCGSSLASYLRNHVAELIDARAVAHPEHTGGFALLDQCRTFDDHAGCERVAVVDRAVDIAVRLREVGPARAFARIAARLALAQAPAVVEARCRSAYIHFPVQDFHGLLQVAERKNLLVRLGEELRDLVEQLAR